MKKSFLIAIGLVLATAAVGLALSYPFQPVYVFSGIVKPGDNGQPVDGDWAVVCRSVEELATGIYGYSIIGPAGPTGLTEHYATNAFSSTFLMSLKKGDNLLIGTVKDSTGYGAGPVTYTVTGKGFDMVPEMTKVLGGGFDPPPPPIQLSAPQFKEIWFGNRMYHANLVTADNQFIVSPTPKIKAMLEAVGDSGIKQDSIQIIIDDGTQNAKTFSMSPQTSTMTTKTVGKMISSLNVEYALGNSDKLSEGDHTFTFKAAEDTGALSTSEVCYVSVMGGPAKIIGPVVFYPSPFSPTKQGQAEIQYTLSVDADIEIFIYSVAGEIVKKIYGRKGQEGGTAGTNKVKWNGQSTYGNVLGNGIYNGTLYDPAQGKTLAKFKATFFH